MPPQVTHAVVADNPQNHEDIHVHTVYNQIAPHFSSTRHKPWPIIAAFLSNLPTGWVGLDSGTGNGKYLPLPSDRPGCLWTIGLDRSRKLLEIARTASSSERRDVVREVVCADVLEDCWRAGGFDYAISIATIHHLSTSARRKLAVQRLLQSVSPAHGRILIYVWAVEQDELSKRIVPQDGPQPEHSGRDVFVPWVMPAKGAQGQDGAEPHARVFERYYHMFAKGELRAMVENAAREMGLEVCSRDKSNSEAGCGVEIMHDGWERSNYYVELRRWTFHT